MTTARNGNSRYKGKKVLVIQEKTVENRGGDARMKWKVW